MPASRAPFDTASALLQEGRLADAEQLMVKELQAAEKKYGRGSPQWASAQCDLGNVLLGGDQAKRAVECFRSACSGPMPDEPEARKDHLTYRLNLGFVLTMIGRLDEAETELRRNLQERLAFYGREHAGYAYGLEALADVLLQRGSLGEANAQAFRLIAEGDAAWLSDDVESITGTPPRTLHTFIADHVAAFT